MTVGTRRRFPAKPQGKWGGSSIPAATSVLSVVILTAAAASSQDLSGKSNADAAAQARTQKLIDSTAGGTIVFRADATGDVIHIQSGMVCARGREAISLTRLVITPGIAPGDDVGCDYVTPGGKLSVFATRAGSQSLKSYAAGSFAAIARMYPAARSVDGPMVLLYEGISPPLAAAFAITLDCKPYITSVWIAQAGN